MNPETTGIDELETMSIEQVLGAIGALDDEVDTLAATHVKDLPRVYVCTRLVADLCGWSKRLIETSAGDDAARKTVQALYDSIRTELLDVIADGDLSDAVAFGLPYCGPDATLGQLGVATELASTYLIALTEVETYVQAKHLESLGAAAAVQRASDHGGEKPNKGERPGTYL